MKRRQPIVHDQHQESAAREVVPDIGVEGILCPFVTADEAAARHKEKDRRPGRRLRCVDIETLAIVASIGNVQLYPCVFGNSRQQRPIQRKRLFQDGRAKMRSQLGYAALECFKHWGCSSDRDQDAE
jgi:hypothetical protein